MIWYKNNRKIFSLKFSSTINEKILKKQELSKAKDKVNKEYLFLAIRDKTIKLWDAIGGI